MGRGVALQKREGEISNRGFAGFVVRGSHKRLLSGRKFCEGDLRMFLGESMPQIMVPPAQDSALVLAFDENEFDVAGLAQFSLDADAVVEALRELYFILRNDSRPRRSNRTRLARVLFAMTSVARDHYADSGHQEYWPYLFDRIEQVILQDRARFAAVSLGGQQDQSLLGQWFRLALEEYGYTIPDEGQTYVGPIVFHAGIPKASLPGALQLIGTAVQHYGPQAINLPVDRRRALVKNHPAPLHRNVERLLVSNLRGAAQLWSCLARVVLAWQWKGDCAEELRQLPAALDPDAVWQALPRKEASDAIRRPRLALPQIRFDPETGEVRLTVPTGTASDWRVSSTDGRIDVRWTQTHIGLTAEFTVPLPEEVQVTRRGDETVMSRTFLTRPGHWPGSFFHASNGNIEDGAVIDANGIDPGRWFVVFEGMPTRWNIPSAYRLSLKWSRFAGHREWTAWEIDVPARSHNQAFLEWHIDDNRFYVPLARRPGPRVECLTEPLTTAFKPSGESVAVFRTAPIVHLCRDRVLSVLLLRERDHNVETVRRIELPADEDFRLPVQEPGVYQLREARGVERVLLHFALVPGLDVKGPIYDAAQTRATVEVAAPADVGQLVTTRGDELMTQNGIARHEHSTVEPLMSLEWKWQDDHIAPLLFQWRLEGLRWRVLRLSDDAARWTRDPILVRRKEVQANDAQLEIQTPAKSELRVNEVSYADHVQRAPAGNSRTLSLLPFGDTVEVALGDGPSALAVIFSERPLLNRLNAVSDGETVQLTWDADSAQAGMAVAAWNPLEPLTEPKVFSLSSDEVDAGACEIACDRLPGESWTSLAVTRLVRVGFSRQVLHLAAQRSDVNRPLALLLDRTTGTTATPAANTPMSWSDFLHRLSLDRVDRRVRPARQVAEALEELHSRHEVDPNRVLKLVSTLPLTDDDRVTSLPSTDREWLDNTRQGLMQFVAELVRSDPAGFTNAINSERVPGWLELLLSAGVALGQSCPFSWLDSDPDDRPDEVYPFRLIRDLWVLGTREADSQSERNSSCASLPLGFRDKPRAAAARVWQFFDEIGFSFPQSLLPISQRDAWVCKTDCHHDHVFALPPRIVDSATAFVDALGLDDLALDCPITCDDHLWDTDSSVPTTMSHSPAAGRGIEKYRHEQARKYSLYWNCHERRWYIERPSMAEPTCCRTAGEPLLVRPIQPLELLEEIDLRQTLCVWAKLDVNEGAKIDPSELLESLRTQLCSDNVVGGLHREILTAPQPEVRQLFGASVAVPSKSTLPECAVVAWQLAWCDRLVAWDGLRRFFPNETRTHCGYTQFLCTLGQACPSVPI